MARHVALFGDSVFDNESYTQGEPDVSAHLRDLLPSAWNVTLCAIDGATTTDVGKQFDRVPVSATHVVMSLGGNDALSNADLLNTPVNSTGAALDLFRSRLDDFETSYGHALDALVSLGRKTSVCTIYNGNLADQEAKRARVALMMFNDIIVRSALYRSVDVIELRHICTETLDFANPIEPSGRGGRKVAQGVAAALSETPKLPCLSTLFGGPRPKTE